MAGPVQSCVFQARRRRQLRQPVRLRPSLRDRAGRIRLFGGRVRTRRMGPHLRHLSDGSPVTNITISPGEDVELHASSTSARQHQGGGWTPSPNDGPGLLLHGRRGPEPERGLPGGRRGGYNPLPSRQGWSAGRPASRVLGGRGRCRRSGRCSRDLLGRLEPVEHRPGRQGERHLHLRRTSRTTPATPAPRPPPRSSPRWCPPTSPARARTAPHASPLAFGSCNPPQRTSTS